MANETPTIYMRLPADVKERLHEAAHDNRRSLAAEVTARLQRSFEGGADAEIIRDQARQIWLLREQIAKVGAAAEALRDAAVARGFADPQLTQFWARLIDYTQPHKGDFLNMPPEQMRAEIERLWPAEPPSEG